MPPDFIPTTKVRVTQKWTQPMVNGFLCGATRINQWQQLWNSPYSDGHGIWVDVDTFKGRELAEGFKDVLEGP